VSSAGMGCVTDGTGRRLLLMRHAKAEPYGPSDRDRPLTRSGRRDAAAVGMWLAEHHLAPDHALVSAAVRSTETCTEVRTAGGFDVDPEIRPELYGAEADEILRAIAQVPPEVTALLYVGHNPGVEVVAAALAGEGERQAMRRLLTGFPTSGLAVYDVPVTWRELDEGAARLADFYVGRG
jgi:phosphohistidine phosphatase